MKQIEDLQERLCDLEGQKAVLDLKLLDLADEYGKVNSKIGDVKAKLRKLDKRTTVKP